MLWIELLSVPIQKLWSSGNLVWSLSFINKKKTLHHPPWFCYLEIHWTQSVNVFFMQTARYQPPAGKTHHNVSCDQLLMKSKCSTSKDENLECSIVELGNGLMVKLKQKKLHTSNWLMDIQKHIYWPLAPPSSHQTTPSNYGMDD